MKAPKWVGYHQITLVYRENILKIKIKFYWKQSIISVIYQYLRKAHMIFKSKKNSQIYIKIQNLIIHFQHLRARE